MTTEDIAVCFRNHALEVYGASMLEENSNKSALMVIFDKVFEQKLK